jgi:acylpyruvate hydrolase
MKIIAVGRNYAAHAREMKSEVPAEPVIFLKPDTALLREGQTFYIPDFSSDIHHEVELVIKINREGKHISEKFAGKYYDEIGIGIDFTARDVQAKLKSKGLPWELSKAFDSSAPVGKFIPKTVFSDPCDINFHLNLNGNTVQKGNTRDLIFKFDFLISYISGFITLRKGDLIFTGTPEGVGPVKSGDRLEAFIEREKMLDLAVK